MLLALLCASLVLTAILVRKSYTPQANLNQSVKILEDNLHVKEKIIDHALNNSSRYHALKTVSSNEREAFKFIDEYVTGKRIWFITLRSGQLSFWGGIKVLPAGAAAIKNGTSFIKQPNGYYEVVKKSDGDFSALFFIPVKSQYKFQNQYLKNTFDHDLLADDNLEIADIADTHVQAVTSFDHHYLFSVKLKGGIKNHVFVGYEVLLWLAILITLCLFVQSLCAGYAQRNKAGLGVLVLTGFIALLRFINLYLHYPAVIFELKVFNPLYYHSNPVFPSLGDLCLNILLLSWLAGFIYYHRYQLTRRPLSSVAAYITFVAGIVIQLFILSKLLELFASLIISSAISFDVENVLNLTAFSLIAVLMLCFCFLIIFLLTEVFLAISSKLGIPVRHKLYLYLAGIICITVVSSALHQSFAFIYILWGLFTAIRGYAVMNHSGRVNPFSFIGLVLLCALIAALKFSDFESVKENEVRKSLIHKLENTEDSTADHEFRIAEKRITSDPALINYFLRPNFADNYLKSLLQRNYFNGYFADYNFKIAGFDARGNPLTAANQYALADFKDMVMYSSFKVSDYFYRENDAFGFKTYFAIIPVYQDGQLRGTITIQIKSKPIQFSYSYPQMLVNNQLASGNEFKSYSYAFYRDGRLQSQNGKYVYNIINNEFAGKLKDYTTKMSRDSDRNKPWYQRLTRYKHIIYQPSKRKLIVVTREDTSIAESVTSLTFFFLVFLVFSITALLVKWLWVRVQILTIRDNHLIWGFKATFNRLLYKTRIQLSMIFAVVLTLIMVGIITYFSIRSQYIDQQDDMMSQKVTAVAAAFENSQADQLQNFSRESQLRFNEFAENFSADLVLFSSDGVPLLTTQPKIYDEGLLARRMNARAYILLHDLQKSVVINNEKIGDLSFKSAYAPIRNSKNATIAYLQLPYFSNVADYRERIGALLNAMINIYALIFIAIGLLAVIIARQITAPLNFVQQSISRTKYGQKNEPIAWERNDEIGALVKEYNKMIAALEHSAHRLAQSERESAWREMAKQVAHEIKNPLTPLKLGLQLLEKSWRDKDPKFDQKFERFSKSFVEQIESLSSIASEFSAFAKMPDTRMERLNVLDILGQAVTIFKHMDNIKIIFKPAADEKFYIMADRDQLLRCFNNLLKNAIEAMPHGRMGIININYSSQNNSILLRIQDNGNGIPENVRERIFQPNFTTKSSGTGLGLAFIKNSIENAGGKVWFETETNAGTTFYLNLPAAAHA